MVCLSCMQKKSGGGASKKSAKKDIANIYMSYIWAKPTWDFFHSFAAKVSEAFYSKNQVSSLKLIVIICKVLPCPHCQEHAANFFTRQRLMQTKTKSQLINLLLAFHNDVNRRTGKALMTLADLKKYENSHFINMTKQFIYIFSQYKGTLGGGLSDTRGRRVMIAQVTSWVNTHYTHFQ